MADQAEFPHVMHDIETYGTGRDAAIVAIGAVRFNPFRQPFDAVVSPDTFSVRIDLTKSQNVGVLTPSTVEWWLRQDRSAQEALLAEPRVPLAEAIGRFDAWITSSPVDYLWSFPPSFDEAILRDAYARHNIPFPLSYRVSRCFRTLKWVGESMFIDISDIQNPLQHDALSDAKTQALTAARILERLSWMLPTGAGS